MEVTTRLVPRQSLNEQAQETILVLLEKDPGRRAEYERALKAEGFEVISSAEPEDASSPPDLRASVVVVSCHVAAAECRKVAWLSRAAIVTLGSWGLEAKAGRGLIRRGCTPAAMVALLTAAISYLRRGEARKVRA